MDDLVLEPLRWVGTALCLLGIWSVSIGVSIASRNAPPVLGHRGLMRSQALHTRPWLGTVQPLLRYLAGTFDGRWLAEQRVRADRRLRLAGEPLGLSAQEHWACALLLGSLGLLAGLALWTAGILDLWLALAALLFGLFIPSIALHRRTAHRRRSIDRALPQAIELAALCMNAGLDLVGSLELVLRERGAQSRHLDLELHQIRRALALGQTRREALSAFAERVRTPAVRDFVTAAVAAEEKGTPLAAVLKVQARMLRMRRSVAAEEAAARASVLLSFPLMLELCSILVVLFGPILLRYLERSP